MNQVPRFAHISNSIVFNDVDFCANKRKLYTYDFFPHFNQGLDEILTPLHF